MSDPFDKLRDPDTSPFEPDVAAIRSRAKHIERRRQQLIGGAAVAVAFVAIAGIFITTRPGEHKTSSLAQGELKSRTSPTVENAPFSAADSAASTSPTPARVLTAPQEKSNAGTAAAPGSASRDLAAKPSNLNVTLSVKDRPVGRGADLTLQACNPSSDTAVERHFGSSQRYDFEVAQDGAVIWRYSDGRAFAQVVGTERFEPKQCRSWKTTWDGRRSSGGPAPPGTYQITGVLTSTDPTRTAARDYCLDIC